MFLEVNGVRLHALVFGEGPRTLLAVGGWTGRWEVFVERCSPEPDSDHLQRWARNVLPRAEPAQAARIIEMWRDDDAPDVELPGTGHVPTMTQPDEVVAAILHRFA